MIVGIDTHANTHHVAVVDRAGRRLGDAGFPATAAGYAAVAAFIGSYGTVLRVGVAGTHSYGAGVTTHLAGDGFDVVEVIRPNRQTRRLRGKSDPIDAYQAAAAAMASEKSPTPKQLDGTVEAIRYVHAARRSATKARIAARVQIKSLLVTAPESIRARYRKHSDITLFESLARVRPTASNATPLETTVLVSLKSLTRRYQYLGDQIAVLEGQLEQLVMQANPGLLQTKGFGVVTAAQLLITAGENSDRLTSEASFAALCGASPIPASSGKTIRYRLNRGGDRNANASLHRIALNRLTYDERTRAYAIRKRQEDKGNKEILRCLKRAIAREAYKLITHPLPAADHRDLRVLRQERSILQVQAAAALNVSTAKISLAENGKIHHAIFINTYAT